MKRALLLTGAAILASLIALIAAIIHNPRDFAADEEWLSS